MFAGTLRLRSLTLGAAFSGFTTSLKSNCHFLPLQSPGAKNLLPIPPGRDDHKPLRCGRIKLQSSLSIHWKHLLFLPYESKFHAGRTILFADVSPTPSVMPGTKTRCIIKIDWMNEWFPHSGQFCLIPNCRKLDSGERHNRLSPCGKQRAGEHGAQRWQTQGCSALGTSPKQPFWTVFSFSVLFIVLDLASAHLFQRFSLVPHTWF